MKKAPEGAFLQGFWRSRRPPVLVVFVQLDRLNSLISM